MSKIPTAEEFFDSSNIGLSNTTEYMYCQKDIEKRAIEFSKLHVEACKEEYLQKGFGRYMNHVFDKNPTRVPIDEDSILNAYPLENIK